MPKKNLLNAKQTNNRHKKECTEVLTVDDMNDLLECNIGLAFITRQDTSQCHESSIHIKSLGLQFSLEVRKCLLQCRVQEAHRTRKLRVVVVVLLKSQRKRRVDPPVSTWFLKKLFENYFYDTKTFLTQFQLGLLRMKRLEQCGPKRPRSKDLWMKSKLKKRYCMLDSCD